MDKNSARQVRSFISHLKTVAPKPAPDLLHARFAGFAAVSAVSNLEQATKDAFLAFAATRHADFEYFVRDVLESFNAQLKLKLLRERHVVRFGEKPLKRFDDLLSKCERRALKWGRVSLKASYGNLITWRHACAHKGYLQDATLSDVARAARAGEIVIRALCLALEGTR